VRGAAKALAAAHESGLVHRDVKPQNILLGRQGAVKLGDFGLAHEVAGDAPTELSTSRLYAGTPTYASPEQAQGKHADGRSDIYSLGATWFYLLTGRPPFLRLTTMDMLAAHVLDEAPDVRDFRPETPARWAAILKRMLAKNADDRHATRSELLRELDGLAADGEAVGEEAAQCETLEPATSSVKSPATKRKRLMLALSAAAVFGVAGLIGFWSFGTTYTEGPAASAPADREEDEFDLAANPPSEEAEPVEAPAEPVKAVAEETPVLASTKPTLDVEPKKAPQVVASEPEKDTTPSTAPTTKGLPTTTTVVPPATTPNPTRRTRQIVTVVTGVRPSPPAAPPRKNPGQGHRVHRNP
jgi:serine/threonine-protein kinase